MTSTESLIICCNKRLYNTTINSQFKNKQTSSPRYIIKHAPTFKFSRPDSFYLQRFPWNVLEEQRSLTHRRHPAECLLRSDYWVKRIYVRLRGAMEQTAIERAVIDKRRRSSILSGHGYRVRPRSRCLWSANLRAPTTSRGRYGIVCSPDDLDFSNSLHVTGIFPHEKGKYCLHSTVLNCSVDCLWFLEIR